MILKRATAFAVTIWNISWVQLHEHNQNLNVYLQYLTHLTMSFVRTSLSLPPPPPPPPLPSLSVCPAVCLLCERLIIASME